MSFIELAASPLAPGVSPVRIHCRDEGTGPPIVFLHGGWGYEIYPFDRQIRSLTSRHRVVIPDRSGYGQSTPIAALPADFHDRAVEETVSVLAALGLERPVLWGHSDGAIIALKLALAHPTAVAAAIVEATHLFRRKPASRAFFDALIDDPRAVGNGVAAALERDHGSTWPGVVERHSRAWRAIGEAAASATDDFYGGRLGAIAIPVLVVHGARDPRTEPGELEALGQALTLRDVAILQAGGHSPHSERATADEVTAIAEQFITRL